MDTAARRAVLGSLLAGGLVSAGAAPAQAGSFTTRTLPVKSLEPGDLVVGPDATVVRVASRKRLPSGRHRLRYTDPHTGEPTAVTPEIDEKGYPAKQPFVVLLRGIAASAVVLSPAPTVTGPRDTGLVVNVRDPAYGAAGDGVADDTAAIQRAIDATARGGTCYLPPGTYLVSSDTADVLVAVDGITIAGAGADLSTLRTAPESEATRVLNVSGRSDVTVRDLCFDGDAHPTTKSGVFANTAGSQKNLTIMRCRFTDFMPQGAATTSAAVYTWTSDGVHVLDNEFTGCGRAVTVDQPDGTARVVGNRITAPSGVMATGILVRRSSSVSESKVVVDSNYVRGADRDPSGVGTEGHAIAAFRVRDVHVTNNHCVGNRRGILVSAQSFGAVVQGNTCVASSDAGIRVEPEITATDTTVGTDVARGITVVGNVCRNNAAIGPVGNANSGKGITISYAAGSTLVGNLCHDNTGDGIFCDSDRVTIVGNVSYNNFRGYSGPPTTGQRSGIRIYEGTGCTVVGNQCFDNQATPTQDYGLSLSTPGRWHVVQGNSFAGNGVGEVYGTDRIREGFFGTPPVDRPIAPEAATGPDAAVVNQLVQGLKDLGLFA